MRLLRSGPYDFSRGMREQAGWPEHATFMNGLVDAGFLLLGGPLKGDRETLHICAAPSEEDVRERFAEDPWAPSGKIVVKSVERWTIVLCPRRSTVSWQQRLVLPSMSIRLHPSGSWFLAIELAMCPFEQGLAP